ncbi:hypothetical protein EBR43_07910 [bacterium]|nr:hypothetical protein [bacterium]
MLLEKIILVSLIVETLLVIWFKSPIQEHFKMFTKIPLQDYLNLKYPLLARLNGCHICISFWLSLFLGITVFDLGIYFLCIPGILYLFNRDVF